MAVSKISAEFDSAFKQALAHKGPANEVLQGCLVVLNAHNLSYQINETPAKYSLVHRCNRNWLMLGPYNCHRNAAKIQAGGADRKMLNKCGLHGAGKQWQGTDRANRG